MIINFIIVSVSLLMLGFVLVWVTFPATRAWFEAPKYRFLETVRPPQEGLPGDRQHTIQ